MEQQILLESGKANEAVKESALVTKALLHKPNQRFVSIDARHTK